MTPEGLRDEWRALRPGRRHPGRAGQSVAGLGWELNAITAAVLGETLLSGGQGSITSTLAGILRLGAIFSVFNLGGTINSYWQWVLRGIFLLAVVVLQGRLAFVEGDPHADRDS